MSFVHLLERGHVLVYLRVYALFPPIVPYLIVFSFQFLLPQIIVGRVLICQIRLPASSNLHISFFTRLPIPWLSTGLLSPELQVTSTREPGSVLFSVVAQCTVINRWLNEYRGKTKALLCTYAHMLKLSRHTLKFIVNCLKKRKTKYSLSRITIL